MSYGQYGQPGEPQDPHQPQQPSGQPPNEPANPYGQPPNEPANPYGQPPSDPANPYGQYGQHNPSGQYGDQSQYGQYGQPGQPGPYGYPQPGGPGQPQGTNVLAILSLVFAFVFAPAGIVLGHLAKKQIRQTHEPGDQFAQWGLVLSYIFTGLYLVGCCAWIGIVLWAGSNDGNTY
jgi:hypothetical protein